MSTTLRSRLPDAAEVAALEPQQLAAMLQQQARTIEALQQQIEWFKRQLFGTRSERFVAEPDARPLHLGEVLGEPMPLPETVPVADQQVPAHKRRKPTSDFAEDAPAAPFFDDSKVPVHTIELPSPEAQQLRPQQYEVVGQKVSHRLAQRPGAYVVLKYVRPVIKRLETNTLHCASAPAGVITTSALPARSTAWTWIRVWPGRRRPARPNSAQLPVPGG